MDSNAVNGETVHTAGSGFGRGAQFNTPVSGLGRGARLLNSIGRGFNTPVPGFGRGAVAQLFNSPDVRPGEVRSAAVSSSHPVSVLGNAGSPVLTSTRLPSHPPTTHMPTDSLSAITDMNSPALSSLITRIAQQVGQSITAQLKGENQTHEGSQVRVQNPGTGQAHVDSTLNLTGVKLVMQSDVREPPVYRGDGSDKLSVHEWEELMDTYLRKRSVPLGEQQQEMLSRLMGKAKDIVKITLHSNPSLKPHENPKVITDILKQHFSGVSCSSMPLADFYSTVPVAGENPVEYWIRLNKAVDAAEEGLSRQGRHIDDPSREVTMMFVKHCPDPSLAAVLRFKAPEKWTAGEIQEHVDRYQIDTKEQLNTRPHRPVPVRPVSAHVQTPMSEEAPMPSQSVIPPVQAEAHVTSTLQFDDSCLRTLIGLLDRTLVQNSQAMAQNNRPMSEQHPSDQSQRKQCKVCKSMEHSTLAHCRRDRLCLSCYMPGHIRKNCSSSTPGRGNEAAHPPREQQPLNSQARIA